ncbi:tetraacyldisaccharide 4'-kinase [Candidatus Spongiihabitans sp.]|uniref:tetraacyldisaccharide 4'-kinase n=1 Tax=Candidatus Spongiihabitans sp. TaxID=3101308 RepID=UPI003C7CCAC6
MLNKLQQGWLRARLLNYLLAPISWCYAVLARLRYGCYRAGIFKSRVLPRPVIVVGGISVGGSGKSPLVIALVNHLKEKGFKPGVIARGYGGKSAFWPRAVNQATCAQLVGDEPQLIFEQCDVPVVVGPDRVRNGYYLLDGMNGNGNCDIVISDDGYQHFALKRTVDIAVVDGQYGFGNGWCLPAGPLREPIAALKRADIVVINGQSTEELLRHIPACCPIYHMSMELQEAYNLADNRRRKLSEFSNRPVHAVAGIGNPLRFFSQLEQAGLDIIPQAFPDHHRFTEHDLSFADNREVLMTEKDAIKCRGMSVAKNIWVVPAKLRVDEELYLRVEALIGKGHW